VAPDWFYKLQIDFTDSGADGIRDAFIGYGGLDDSTDLRIGQFTEPASLEDTMSSKYITFMERGLPILAFVPAARRIGVGVRRRGPGWSTAAGVFGENVASDETDDDGVGAAARFTLNPVRGDGRLVHLGASVGCRDPRGGTERFRARPEAHVDDTRFVDTGVMTNVDSRVLYGAEVACMAGPFSLQGEYLAVQLDREDACTAGFDGYYISTSLFLTGESRAYDPGGGEFVRTKPLKPFGDGGIGAWEIAARFSSLDLDDEVRGGTQENVTLGLNWYANAHTRFMLNVVHASAEHDEGDIDADIVQFRGQLDF